jgi:hypothetical protein
MPRAGIKRANACGKRFQEARLCHLSTSAGRPCRQPPRDPAYWAQGHGERVTERASRIETETKGLALWHALAALAALLAIAAVIAAIPVAARAAIADQSVAYQLDPQHDGNLTSVPLTPPLAKQWSDTFGNGP